MRGPVVISAASVRTSASCQAWENVFRKLRSSLVDNLADTSLVRDREREINPVYGRLDFRVF